MLAEHDGKLAEMRTPRWRKIARTIKIRDKLRVQLFTPTDVFIRLLPSDTASDPKIEWPLIADHDIELVAANSRMYDYTDGAAQRITL